jgi:hypothetical protein
MFSNTIDARSLLRDDLDAGYAPEFVRARLHGRDASLTRAAAAGLSASRDLTDEQIWSAFLAELDWLFRQMDARMRAGHAPLFALFEMKTIVLCLRHAALGRAAPGRLLDHSLLSLPIQRILREPRPAGVMVASLADVLGGLSRPFLDLDTRYFESGLRGCEDALMRLFLEAVAPTRLTAPVRMFLTHFTDLRNVMALYKHVRWQIKGPLVLINGGSLVVPALKDVVITQDHAALDALVASITGRAEADSELSLETSLLAALTHRLAQASRRKGDDWIVAHYVWSRYVHARNLAVRQHASGLDRTVLARELIA